MTTIRLFSYLPKIDLMNVDSFLDFLKLSSVKQMPSKDGVELDECRKDSHSILLPNIAMMSSYVAL